MKKILMVVGFLAFFAIQTKAADITILANGFDVAGTSVQKLPHFVNPSQFGDSHTDVEIDQDWNTNASEIAYFHFPYPKNLNDGGNIAFIYNFETNETNPALSSCLRTVVGAQTSTDTFYSGFLTNFFDVLLNAPINGAGLNRRFVSGVSSTGQIRRANNLPCTHATCDDTIVHAAIRRIDSIAICTAPSTATFRIVSAEVLLNQ